MRDKITSAIIVLFCFGLIMMAFYYIWQFGNLIFGNGGGDEFFH